MLGVSGPRRERAAIESDARRVLRRFRASSGCTVPLGRHGCPIQGMAVEKRWQGLFVDTFTDTSGHPVRAAPRDEAGEVGRAGLCAAAGSPSLRCRGVTAKRAAQRRRRALKPSDGVVRRATARAPWSPTTRAGAAVAAGWATHPPTAVQGHTRVHTLRRLVRGGGTHEPRLSPPPPPRCKVDQWALSAHSLFCLSPGNGRVEVGASAAGTRRPVEAPELHWWADMARRHVPPPLSRPIRQEPRMVAERAGGGKEKCRHGHLYSGLSWAAEQTEMSPLSSCSLFLDDHRVFFLAVSCCHPPGGAWCTVEEHTTTITTASVACLADNDRTLLLGSGGLCHRPRGGVGREGCHRTMMVFHNECEERRREHVCEVERPDQRVRPRHCLANNRGEEAGDPQTGEDEGGGPGAKGTPCCDS